MFIIRTIFWLAVVVALLPAGEPAAGSTGPSIGPATIEQNDDSGFGAKEAVHVVLASFNDVMGFCERNTEVCQTGGTAVRSMQHKLAYWAGVVHSTLSEAQRSSESSPTRTTSA